MTFSCLTFVYSFFVNKNGCCLAGDTSSGESYPAEQADTIVWLGRMQFDMESRRTTAIQSWKGCSFSLRALKEHNFPGHSCTVEFFLTCNSLNGQKTYPGWKVDILSFNHQDGSWSTISCPFLLCRVCCLENWAYNATDLNVYADTGHFWKSDFCILISLFPLFFKF